MSTPLDSVPRVGPLQRLAPTQTIVLLLPALLANSRVVVVERVGVALLHRVLAIDAVREPLVLLGQADVLALADLEWVGEVFIIVAAGQKVVDLDAHIGFVAVMFLFWGMIVLWLVGLSGLVDLGCFLFWIASRRFAC